MIIIEKRLENRAHKEIRKKHTNTMSNRLNHNRDQFSEIYTIRPDDQMVSKNRHFQRFLVILWKIEILFIQIIHFDIIFFRRNKGLLTSTIVNFRASATRVTQASWSIFVGYSIDRVNSSPLKLAHIWSIRDNYRFEILGWYWFSAH